MGLKGVPDQTDLSVSLERPSPLVRVRRHPERARYDRETVHAILDEALFCHVAFVKDGDPLVLPTIHVRMDDTLYLHGAPAAGLLQAASEGIRLCVAVTLLDGIVLARSAYDHSMNYRSVVVFGRGREVTDRDEKARVFDALVEHVLSGRSKEARRPSDVEIRATRLVKVPIEEASAKIRTGPPKDGTDDLALPIWAGVVPIRLKRGDPIPDPLLDPAIPLPRSLIGPAPKGIGA